MASEAISEAQVASFGSSGSEQSFSPMTDAVEWATQKAGQGIMTGEINKRLRFNLRHLVRVRNAFWERHMPCDMCHGSEELALLHPHPSRSFHGIREERR